VEYTKKYTNETWGMEIGFWDGRIRYGVPLIQKELEWLWKNFAHTQLIDNG
jgi:hypothetical protein